MRVELAPAVVLHRRPWQDTSLIVEAFAREQGRVGLLAKGARRPKARWRGLLEPLAAVELSWSGRGELFTLTAAEPRVEPPLQGNSLMAGFYATELVLRLLARHDPHPPVYDSLSALLSTLRQGAPAVVALRFFERDLLDELGYGIPLETVSQGGAAVTADGTYIYEPGQGLTVDPGGEPPAGAVRIGGRALLGLAAGRFVERADIQQAKALMQIAINAQLDGRPLKSVATLQAMQQFKQRGRAPSSGEST